jgi:hypothetical protein
MRIQFNRKEPPDPGIREVVQRLQNAGFIPVDCSDGNGTPEDMDDQPFVYMASAPENLIAEAHRLHVLVKSWGVPAFDNGDFKDADAPFCGVLAGYDPRDREAHVQLWGISDGMLPT